jgi:hypothetical protein
MADRHQLATTAARHRELDELIDKYEKELALQEVRAKSLLATVYAVLAIPFVWMILTYMAAIQHVSLPIDDRIIAVSVAAISTVMFFGFPRRHS